MLELKQSATDKVIPFLLVSTANHIDGATGLTPAVIIAKNGGAFGAPAGAVSEMGNGWYKLTPAAADTNTAGSLVLHVTAAGADPSDRECLVVAVDPYDAAGGGMSRLDQAVSTRATPAQILATPANPLATDGTGRVTVGANADKNGYGLNLAQAVPVANTANTVGDALNAARVQGFGKWVRSGTTLTLFAPDGITPAHVFTLDDPLTPTQRI